MPIIINGKTHQWAQFGKPLDLNGFSVQKINVTVEFPHVVNSANRYDCKPLTVNLLKDIGVNPNSRVYCVKWGDDRPETDTMSNGYIVYRHEHTYEGPKDAATYSKTFTITLYGMQLYPFKGNVKQVGTPPNGFKITSVENSYLPKRSSRFISFGTGIDRSIYNGARILKGILGRDVFYHRDIQGTAVTYEIAISGSNEVRLVNPLVIGNYNWDNKRTSIMVDWGDGARTIWYNKKINSGLFNVDSTKIPKHTYEAVKGDRFVITVESMEPLVPIGCNVISIDGSFPEDCYTGTPLFSYTDVQKTNYPFRAEIENIRRTTVTLGGGLLANWINVKNMASMFSDWDELVEIPDGFFGDNIRDNVSDYTAAFYNCSKLRKVDPYLLGETNDVVRTMTSMFRNTSVKEPIRLKYARNLVSADHMYCDTGCTKIVDFLVDVPKLKYIQRLFDRNPLETYDSSFLQNSPSIVNASSFLKDTKITELNVNMRQWHQIEELIYAYHNTNIKAIPDGTFGGDFGKDSPNKSINMSHIFNGICSHVDWKCDVGPLAFRELGNIHNKLANSQVSYFRYARIKKLHDGLFDGVFAGEGRFGISSMFSGIKTDDNFGYKDQCIHIPEMFRRCSGIISAEGLFANTCIGYLNANLLKDCINLEDVRDIFLRSKFYTHFPEKFFFYNKKISNFIGVFNDAIFIYQTNLDFLIWSEVDKVLVFALLKLSNMSKTCVCNRLFGKSSTVKTVDGTLPDNGAISPLANNMTNTVELSTMLGGRTSTGISGYVVNDTVIKYIITCLEDTTVTLFSKDATVVKYKINNTEYINSSSPLETNVSMKRGTHSLYVKSDKPVHIKTNLGNDNFIVTGIFGEFPRGSVIENVGTTYSCRDVGRYVFAQCSKVVDISFLGKSPILHKEIFRYVSNNEIDIPGIVYGLHPRIFAGEHRNTTLNIPKILAANQKVLHKYHLVKTAARSANPITYGNMYCRDNLSSKINSNTKQERDSNSVYIEFRLSGVSSITLEALSGANPVLPIKVEVANRGKTKLSEYTINSLSDSIPVTEDCFVRVWTSVPVWISQKSAITEIFGTLPQCNFTWKFKDLAPNLKRIGELFFVLCDNTSFRQTFKGLSQFEYFPGTLFWYNDVANDYEECFADCPKLFKVDDYIITDKKGDINCKGMFKNSGVKFARYPIASDIIGKVSVQDMFLGCTTPIFYSSRDKMDATMFDNIDIYGKSGIVFDNSNSITDIYYSCTDLNDEVLSKMSYVISNRIMSSTDTNIKWNNIFKYASQSIENQTLSIKNSVLTTVGSDITRYTPFIFEIVADDTPVATPYVKGTFDYMERLMYCGRITGNFSTKFPSLMLYRNTEIERLNHLYDGCVFANDNIADLLPWNGKAMTHTEYTFANTRNLVVDNNWIIPLNALFKLKYMFAYSDVNIPVGFWGTGRRINPKDGNKIDTSYIFYKNTGTKAETGLWKSYKHFVGGVGQYKDSVINTIDVDGCFTGVDINYMSELNETFMNSKLTELPTINHMTRLRELMHTFEGTEITEVPENYIYTTSDNCSIDYMFADCPNLFINYIFIDPRSTSRFSIDYSLNNVFSSLGDDPDIFGHINYDNAYEHRSRVIPFAMESTWTQVIEVLKPNTTVKLVGLYNKDLVGFTPEKIFAVMWGDGSPATIVSNRTLTLDDISHNYKDTGRYEVRVMLRNDCCYIETPIIDEPDVITVDLPTSFKFGKITDIRDKGLYNMFGDGVEHISKELFNNLEGVNTIEVYNDMFKGFKNLSNLESGILDCMPNLRVMKNFLYDSKGNVELTLKSNLLSKLTKLTDIENFAYISNVNVVESGLFNTNTGITSLLYAFSESKVVELPRDLLSKLTALTNVNSMLHNSNSFILDESYSNFFINNRSIQFSSQTFLGTKISAIPNNIMKPLVNLVNAAEMFATAHHINSSQPWDTGAEEIKVDANNYSIPDSFLSTNTKLQYAENMFAGRKSLKSYPANLLSTTKALSSAKCMFMQTGITEIHRGTFDGYTNNIDVNFMFYGCMVGDCKSPIINSTGVFKTYGMLFGATGEPTEAELFSGVKTDPADIQSMYRQGFEYYIVDVNVDISGTAYLKALEPSSFPWNGFVMEVDYQDNNPLTIDENIPNQEALTRVTSRVITTGARTIKIKVPFAVEIGGVGVTYKRLYGVFGRMITNNHVQFRNTNYKNSTFTIDSDAFYKRNVHLTSINHAFAETNIEYVKTNAFSSLPNVSTMIQAFYDTPNFKIKDGYKPNFDHMRLTDITESFFNDLSLVVNKDWEPFKNIPTIVKAERTFAVTGIITTPYINTTSLTSIKECYWLCSDLTTTYADILNGASKCSNYFGLFRGAVKLTTIEGESDNHSIGDTATTNVTANSSVNYSHMFENTGLKQQQIIRIVNNLGGFKSTLPLHIWITEMFNNTTNTGNNDAKPELRIRSNDKILTARSTFYNTRLSNIPNQAVTLTGNSSIDYFENMFYNCFAGPDVEIVANVFNVQGQPANTEWNDSKLNTLNVFKINVTPKKVEQASVMMINTNTADSLADTIPDKSIPDYNSGDSIIDVISDNDVVVVNKSDTTIIESVKEE